MSRYVDNKYYHVSSLHLVMGNVWSKGTVLDTLPIIILKSGYMKIKTTRTQQIITIILQAILHTQPSACLLDLPLSQTPQFQQGSLFFLLEHSHAHTSYTHRQELRN